MKLNAIKYSSISNLQSVVTCIVDSTGYVMIEYSCEV